MSRYKEIEDEVFINFIFSKDRQLPKSRIWADYITGLQDQGVIKIGDFFPGVKFISKHNDMSFENVTSAYKLMKERGYLEQKPGQRGQSKLPSSVTVLEEPSLKVIYANFHCKQSVLNTVSLDLWYHKSRFNNCKERAPVMENAVSQLLIQLWTNRLSNIHGPDYQIGSFFYVHGYQYLLRAVCVAIYQEGSVIVIPAQFDGALKLALLSLKMSFVEVTMNKNGLNLSELTAVCASYKVAGIFMTSKASLPQLFNTSAKRINAIFLLQQKYGFKLVEIDFYAPWLVNKSNLVLKYADKAINDVIYLTPISYLLKDMGSLMGVSANPEIINSIKNQVKADGKQAIWSVANATFEVMANKKFSTVEATVAAQVAKQKNKIIKVFSVSNFWEMRGLKADAGLAFFLVPKSKHFPANAYQELEKLGIHIYDPAQYNGSSLTGIRLDLSHYIGHKTFLQTLQKIEQHCRSICN